MSLTVILFDKALWRNQLLPLSATRPVGNFRIGICTLNEKWEKLLNAPVAYLTADYLIPYHQRPSELSDTYLLIRANVLPSMALLAELEQLQLGEVLQTNQHWIAMKLDHFPTDLDALFPDLKPVRSSADPELIEHPEDVFLKNKAQLLFDFNLLTQGRTSARISSSNQVLGEWIFVEEGVELEGASLNSLSGPIYLGKDAIVEEGSFLRGYVSVGAEARVKIGAKLYPNVTIGPGSTVAGEINNTVIWGNSAKGHEGYLGCSVIGEGCNIGAGTSNSNLKNNWQTVKLYDYDYLAYRDTEELKCGMIMGDQAMLGIQSSVNTGTVIGVAAQVAITNFIPKFVPDFTWIMNDQVDTYHLDKFVAMIDRRKLVTGADYSGNIAIFEYIYHSTNRLRDEVINKKTKK